MLVPLNVADDTTPWHQGIRESQSTTSSAASLAQQLWTRPLARRVSGGTRLQRGLALLSQQVPLRLLRSEQRLEPPSLPLLVVAVRRVLLVVVVAPRAAVRRPLARRGGIELYTQGLSLSLLPQQKVGVRRVELEDLAEWVDEKDVGRC